MDVEEAVYAHLIANAGVIAAIGNRLYPGAAPSDCASPYAVYFEAGQRFARAMTGTLPLEVYDMRIDVFADTYDGAKDARKAIYDALISKGNETLADGSVTVRGVFHEASDAGHVVPIHATETGEFRGGLKLAVHAGATT